MSQTRSGPGAPRIRHEEHLPPTAVGQLRRLCGLLQELLPSLRGVVLHGSAATSGFEPDRSDLDVLAFADPDPATGELAELAAGLVEITLAPHPLEFSLVPLQALAHWTHPCRHLLHFGDNSVERFRAGDFAPQSETDEDLTMHLVVARARGLDLLGSFPPGDLPVIPERDFLAAVLSDFEWAAARGSRLAGYALSNAARTLAFLREGLVLSKTEGRAWCAEQGLDEGSLVAVATRELRARMVSV